MSRAQRLVNHFPIPWRFLLLWRRVIVRPLSLPGLSGRICCYCAGVVVEGCVVEGWVDGAVVDGSVVEGVVVDGWVDGAVVVGSVVDGVVVVVDGAVVVGSVVDG
ncbi:hypothetical protein [Ensifer canadensis]